MANNITKFLESNRDQDIDELLSITTAIGTSIGCDNCPARKYCATREKEYNSCMAIFKDWALTEE